MPDAPTLPHPRPESFGAPFGPRGWLLIDKGRSFVSIALSQQRGLLALKEGRFAAGAERLRAGRFTAQRERRATAGGRRLCEEDQSSAGLFCREPEAIPRPQRDTHGVLRKHIAHIEHDGGEAPGLK